MFVDSIKRSTSLLNWTHYPYRAIERDPFANSKVLVFHIMPELYTGRSELSRAGQIMEVCKKNH